MEGQKPETKSDEIDLGQLFSRIGDGIRAMWMSFMRLLATLRRIPIENKLLFALTITASIVVGIVITLGVRTHYYESKMIFSSDYLNTRLAKNIIDKLNLLGAEKTKHGLAVTLGLPDSVAKRILSFKIEPFMAETDVVELELLKEQMRVARTAANEDVIEEVIKRIEIENRHSYEITVRTSSPQVVSKLEAGIIGHFQHIPYIEKRVAINEQNLLDLKEKLSRDIATLDSLKSAIHQSYTSMATQSKGSNNVILGDKAVSDPVEVFNSSIDIYELYEDVNRDLYTKKDFEVIDGFTQFNEPANASILSIIIEAFLIGIVVSYAFVAMRDFNTYLANLK